MVTRRIHPSEPCYVISVVARLVNMHPQTLRYYEKLGLIQPSRSDGRIRLFSARDVERLHQIQELQDAGVNPAGVKVILELTERIARLEAELAKLRTAAGSSVGDSADAVPSSPHDAASPSGGARGRSPMPGSGVSPESSSSSPHDVASPSGGARGRSPMPGSGVSPEFSSSPPSRLGGRGDGS